MALAFWRVHGGTHDDSQHPEQGHYEDTADEPREHAHPSEEGHYEDTADEPRKHAHPEKQGHYEDTADEPREHPHTRRRGTTRTRTRRTRGPSRRTRS